MIHIIALFEIIDRKVFHDFETQAVKIMVKYGGKLVSAFEPDCSESSSANVGEIHFLQFPDLEAFKNYRSDPQLIALSELRKQAISSASVFISGRFNHYQQ